MSKIDELEQFRDIRDKCQSQYTIIINNISVEDIISLIYKKIEVVKTIKDIYKRKYLNDRIYSFIEYFKQFEPETIKSEIYLLGKNIINVPLTKKWINTLNEWNIPNFIFENGEYFDIDYANSLLLDNEYYDVIKIINKKMLHSHLNRVKQRVKHEQNIGGESDLNEYIANNVNSNNKCLLHGVSSITKNVKPTDKMLVFTKTLSDDEIFKEFDKDVMLQIHQEVEELIGHLQNEKMMNRVLIGKNIQKGIKYSQIQTLYCSPKMVNNIKNKVPIDLQNFIIIEVLTLKTGDVGDILERSYQGAIGFTYF